MVKSPPPTLNETTFTVGLPAYIWALLNAQTRTPWKGPEPKAKVQVSKERVEFDRKCATLRQEHARLQRGPDDAAREQRVEAMRSEYAACR